MLLPKSLIIHNQYGFAQGGNQLVVRSAAIGSDAALRWVASDSEVGSALWVIPQAGMLAMFGCAD